MSNFAYPSSHESGQERLEQLERCPCAHQEGHRVNSPALGTPISTTNGETFSRSEGDDATEALNNFSCDACSRLKQPPDRRQVAIAHAEMFNDVVSMDVNFWTFKERHSREKKTLTVLNMVDAASGMHIASKVPIQTSHAPWKTFARGWLRWAGAPKMSQSGSSS